MKLFVWSIFRLKKKKYKQESFKKMEKCVIIKQQHSTTIRKFITTNKRHSKTFSSFSLSTPLPICIFNLLEANCFLFFLINCACNQYSENKLDRSLFKKREKHCRKCPCTYRRTALNDKKTDSLKTKTAT